VVSAKHMACSMAWRGASHSCTSSSAFTA
jgi:hypothetical protein